MNDVAQPSAQQVAVAEAPESLGGYVQRRVAAFRAGELGSIPLLFGMVLIVIVFSSLSDAFLKESNFVNLMVQMAGITTIAMGIVFVLLIAEIDLSVGYVSGVAGVTAALLMVQDGNEVPGLLAVPAALALGAAIGALHGAIITKVGVPSFVVTLAGLLAWNGVVLILMGARGTVVIQDDLVIGIANNFLSDAVGWIAAAAAVVLFGLVQLAAVRARKKAGFAALPLAIVVLRIAVIAAAAAAVVYYANRNRGVPYVAVLVLALLVVLTYVASRTRFGRYVYAIGGNAEAARRAGINVDRIKIAVFMISGAMAALGGIILASRLRSVNIAAGGGEILLNSIAAAVIGGTSLFGGRGDVKSALLGALVIASVANGMGLLGYSSGVKFLVTGLILLAAVTVDSLSRRRLAATGR
ncbi:MAG: sugar ABC transporter permease [Gaiellaceae bacterium]